MYNTEELKGTILLSASTLGIDVNLNGTDLSSTDLRALKRTLIEDFRIDPVVATFVTLTLKSGIDFDWLEMYEDKRALYQINLGIIQGMDMSFAKSEEFDALQLEAIRQWRKKGVDMSDLSFRELPHQYIRALAAIKQAGYDYVPLVTEDYSAGYLRLYLTVIQMLKDVEEKEVFLRFSALPKAKRLLEEGINLNKLSLIGFFDAKEDDQLRLLSQLGSAFLKGFGDDVRWIFDHIELFSLQEIYMLNDIIVLKNFKELKMANCNPTTIILKGLRINYVNGDIRLYETYFTKYYQDYYDKWLIDCIQYGLDVTPLLSDKIDSTSRAYMLKIINTMVTSEYGVIYISNVLNILEKSFSLIEKPKNFFRDLNAILTEEVNFAYVDFEILLDSSIPEELKTFAIIGKHVKKDAQFVRDLNISPYRQSRLLTRELHPDVLSVLYLGKTIERAIDGLNEYANLLDIFKLDLENLRAQNLKILGKFYYLKGLPGFYELGHVAFKGKAIFLCIDALELGLDISPIVKHKNGYYAEKMVKRMIEKHLNTNDYIPHSETEFCSISPEDLF